MRTTCHPVRHAVTPDLSGVLGFLEALCRPLGERSLGDVRMRNRGAYYSLVKSVTGAELYLLPAQWQDLLWPALAHPWRDQGGHAPRVADTLGR